MKKWGAGSEKIFDELNNDFGWANPLKTKPSKLPGLSGISISIIFPIETRLSSL